MKKRIGLLVGNGFTLSFRQWAGPTFNDFDPSNPLKWRFNVPGPTGIPWQEAFPVFANEVAKFSGLSSFEIFDRLLQEAFIRSAGQDLTVTHGTTRAQLDWQARQFLCFAYVHFHEKYMAHPVIGWPWTQWLCRYAYAVDAAVSFNYEMLLEVVLQNYSKLKLWGMTDEARSDRVLVFKPHGSIDYTTSTTTWKDVSLPTDRYLAYSNSDMRLMMPGELRDVRPQPFAILPTEASHFVEHWQFQMCFDRWKTTIAPRLTHVVIVGLSYSLCDRSEIDELLSAVSPRAKIVVADPYPSEDLKAMILESGRPYTQWLDGPKPL